MINLGTVRPGSTIRIPFSTFDKDDGSSATMTNYVAADILVYKDGSTTERASTAGFTATTDFDAKTGKHLAELNLADNTTAGFWSAGSEYLVAVDAVTVDGVTTGAWIGRFLIGYEGAFFDTTIASLSTQTSFTLTTGPAEDNALNGRHAVIHDVASAVQRASVLISGYTGSTKTITLAAGATFTVAAGDNISIMDLAPLQPATLGRTLVVDAAGLADANAVKIGPSGSGSAQTARDVGASVLLSSGTGAGQISLSSGLVTLAGVTHTGAVIPTVTTLTGHTAQTGDAFARLGAPAGASVSADVAAVKGVLPAALVSGRMDASVGAMAANVITSTAFAADAITDAKVASDVTIASVTGSVGSVTGAVGSVTGAVGSVTGNVGGNVTGSVGSVTTVSTGAISEASFATTAGSFAPLQIVDQGTAQSATGTTLVLRAAAAFADSELVGCQILVTGGSAGVGQVRTITGYVGSTDTATVDTWTTTPTGTITYKVLASVSPSTGGSGLDAAGTRAALGLATANLDTQLSGIQSDTNDIQTRLPAALVSGRIDSSVGAMATNVITSTAINAAALNGKGDWNIGKTGYSLTQTFPTNFASMSITVGGLTDITQAAADKAWSTTTRVLTAGTNIALAKGTGVTGFNDIAATAIVSAGAITTSGGAVSTVSTLTGHTPQTGDSFARLGAPAGASVSADVAAVKADTGNLVTRITSTLFTGITSMAQWLGLIAGKQTGNSTARTELRATGAGSGTFDETTDSVEALRDRGDAAWTTGAGGDPWGTALPGSYSAGQAGKIIGDYLNASVSSRATQTSVDDIPTNAELATALGTADDAVLAVLGTPAGASVSADIAAVKTQTAAIETDTQDIQSRIPAALVSGRIDSSVGAMAANVMTAAAAAADLTTELQAGLATASSLSSVAADVTVIREYADNTVVRGTVSATSPTTTTFTPSALSPSGAAADQFKGRIIVFDNDTTTASLRGQATDITANTSAALPLFTFTALTTAPSSGDTFSIV